VMSAGAWKESIETTASWESDIGARDYAKASPFDLWAIFCALCYALPPLECECRALDHLNPHLFEGYDTQFTGQEKAQKISKVTFVDDLSSVLWAETRQSLHP
jgi:hypothetical protein